MRDIQVYHYDPDVIKVYFACGIAETTPEDREWHAQIIEVLAEYCEVMTEFFTDPDVHEVNMTDIEIFERDIALLTEAYAMVAEVSVLSHGVGFELGMIDDKKPVLCLCLEERRSNLSAMVAGNRNFLIRTYKEIADLPTIFDEFFDDVREFIKRRRGMTPLSCFG